MNIGENIKKYRKQKGLTQKQLASLSNYSESGIRKIENSARIPNSKALISISKALGVTEQELINYDILSQVENKLVKNKINETIENIEKIILREGYNPNLVYMKGTLDGLKIALKILNNESEEN